MARFGFVGGSYQAQAVNADCQMSMNWYPEVDGSGQGKSALAMYPTPGLALEYGVGPDPCRGKYAINGREFAVVGAALYELFADLSYKNWGTVANDASPVSMAGGPNQLLIASAGKPYVFDLQGGTLTALPTGGVNQLGSPISMVTYCDGFFIALQGNSNKWFVSNSLDATTWPYVSLVQVFTDNVLSILEDHREVWFWGPKKAVVYFDSGAALFPFDVIPGAILEQGIAAPFSAARLDNSVFWLGSDERGNGIVWRAQGYTPQRISNHAVELDIQGFSTISDAIAYGYQENGHSFYEISFPTANKTWVYDVATGMWHERGFFDPKLGKFTMHRGQFHTFSFGKHLVADPTIGNIYEMSTRFVSDFGHYIRRVRRAPHISSENEWTIHHRLQVDMETGLGFEAFAGQPQTLQDSNGIFWAITVDDNGRIRTTKVPTTTTTAVFLNDPSNARSWQLSVDILGRLTTNAVTFNAAYSKTLSLISVTGLTSWNLGVTLAGLLTTTEASQAIFVSSGSPQIMLRWSDDGGHTWSNEHIIPTGAAGQFKTRAIWRRLGRARDRVYELSSSDLMQYRIVDAYLQATPGFTSPTERLTKQMTKVA